MTVTTTASAELRKLQKARDTAHAELKELESKLIGWDTEGLPPGTVGFQADLHGTRRERKHGPNPHREQFEAARATYLEHDVALQAFKRTSAADRIAEVTEALDSVAVREAWERLREEVEHHRLTVEGVRSIIFDTPGIDGQALGFDGRIEEWASYAEGALRGLDEGELIKPGLTPAAEVKLDG